MTSPWNVPNALSLTRIPLAAVFPFTLGHPASAICVLAVAAATDVLDGWWARSRGQATTLGAVLDPITDKIFVGVVVGSLVATGMLHWGAIVCLATREIGEAPLVAWLLVSAHQRGRRTAEVRANVPGKLVTVLQFACVVLVVARSRWQVDRTLLGVTAAFGALAAASYWRRALRRPTP